MKTCCLSQLCKKEIICIDTGKILGCPSDVEIDCRCGQILYLTVPQKGVFSLLGGKECIKIPWCDVDRIGEDVIWVCDCGKDNKNGKDNKRNEGCCC